MRIKFCAFTRPRERATRRRILLAEKNGKKRKQEKRRNEKGKEARRSGSGYPKRGRHGTTKSNPPSKIESRRGSVYLMKEKRRDRENLPTSPKIKRVDRVEKTKESGQEKCVREGGEGNEKREREISKRHLADRRRGS